MRSVAFTVMLCLLRRPDGLGVGDSDDDADDDDDNNDRARV